MHHTADITDLDHKHIDPGKTSDRLREPVCGMVVDPAITRHRTENAGQPFYFCWAGCLEKINAFPVRHLPHDAPAPARRVTSGPIYTCPMQPEVRQDDPGACPICGMAVEPVAPTREPMKNSERADRGGASGPLLPLPCRSSYSK